MKLSKREWLAVRQQFVIVIVMTLSACSGCDNQPSDQAKQKCDEIRGDQTRLVPGWYRARYAPFPATEKWLEGVQEVAYNQLWKNISLLGLFFYFPLLVVIRLKYGNSSRGKYVHTRGPYTKEQASLESLFGTFLLYPANLTVSVLLYLFLTLLMGLFTDQGYFIPWDFLSFSVHIILLLTFFFMAITPRPLEVIETLSGSFSASSITRLAVQKTGRKGWKMVIAAGAKALLIAIASGIASQIGGWIAGIIVMAIGAGFATAFHPGDSLPPSESH